jgi:hypothetical protein
MKDLSGDCGGRDSYQSIVHNPADEERGSTQKNTRGQNVSCSRAG